MVTIANRYQLQDKLGEGGMGAVYRAFDPLEQTTVALKRVRQPIAQLQFNSKGTFSDERTAMVQEFRTLASLRHPNIISVLDYGFDDEQNPFFTMDLLDHATTILDYGRAQSDQEKSLLLVQTLQALIYLHRRDILHRDLKPANILVLPDGTVKVLDFGLSASTTQAQGTAGTLAYMAPEVLLRQPVSRATDLYAVGMMAYELLIGTYPFEAKNPMRLIEQIVQTIPDVSSITNQALQMVMMRWLMKNAEDRYQSAQATILALCDAVEIDPPQESITIRESFLQASEFVGRDAELKTLQDELASVMAGATSFYLVGGESGVGKSRLLDELRTHALVSGTRVLRGQAVEGGGLPFQLWRNITRRLLLMAPVTDLQAGILKDIVPDMDDLLGRTIARAPKLTGKVYQERLVLTIVDLLREVKQPLVLILEDLQWVSEGLVVLKQMLKVREQLPQVMVVGNYRNDEAPKLPDELTGMRLMRLDRFDTVTLQQLSQSMLGTSGTNEDVIELLHQETEGNLFFLIETVRALAEEAGSLEQIGRATLPNSVFTEGMQQIMQRRLHKVSPAYQPIQTLAAVIGREIDMDLLVYQYDRITVENWLINAAENAILDIQDNAWRFAHDKLREALVADISDETLPNVHRTAAEAIETMYPDDAGYNEALLTHWHIAGDFDKELIYLGPVAQKMIDIQGVYEAARNLLNAALARMGDDDVRQVSLLNLLASSHQAQGEYKESIRFAERARQLAKALGDDTGYASSLHILGRVAWRQGDYARALDLFQQSLAIFEKLGDQIGIASSLNDMGNIALEQGEYARALDLLQQGLAISQALGDQRGIANSLGNMGGIATHQGDYARALDLYQQSLAISQALGDQRGIAISLGNMVETAYRQGEFEKALDLLQQSLVIYQVLGDQHGMALNLNNMGLIVTDQGDYARASDLCQQSLVIFQAIGEQRGIALSLNNMGVIARKQGEYARASDLLQQSLVIYQAIGDQHFMALNLGEMGLVASAQGDYARALDLYQQCLAIFQELDIQYGVTQCLSEMGWLALKQGQTHMAAAHFVASLRIAVAAGITPVILHNVVGLAGVLKRQDSLLRAAELVGLAQAHPSVDSDTRRYIDELMPQLEAALSPDELQAALERGKSLDLDTVVQELLDEFAPTEDDKAT